MHMAVGAWHLVEISALNAGLWGVPGAPAAVHGLDLTVFLALLENTARSTEENSEVLDKLYADRKVEFTRKTQRPAQNRADRRAEIERFMAHARGQ